MRAEHELDLYETAYLCGGPERVAIVVLVALSCDGQIKVSVDRHRVHAVRRAPRDAIEKATLEVIPEVGRVLGLTMLMIAASSSVGQVGERLRDKRVLPSSRAGALWQWARVRKARRLRHDLAGAQELDGLARVAVTGASAIEDGDLREIFETHKYEPPKSLKLTKTRPRTFDSIDGYESPYRPVELSYLASQTGIY